jgi:hypothetical protein
MVDIGTGARSNLLVRHPYSRVAAVSLGAIIAAAMAIIVPGSPMRPTSGPPRIGAGTTTTVAHTPTAVVATPAISAPSIPAPATTGQPAIPPAAAAAPQPTVTQTVPAEPAIATLVAQVEAAGIQPGSNWSWSMGDTSTHCGPLSGAGTGCTFGTGGLEFTVFSGSPTLALVAHELANAETQNDAVPNLLSQVAAAAGSTSWSPTDAVASCLVAHFLGFQDGSAGSWQCSPALATTVADNIHDTL